MKKLKIICSKDDFEIFVNREDIEVISFQVVPLIDTNGHRYIKDRYFKDRKTDFSNWFDGFFYFVFYKEKIYDR